MSLRPVALLLACLLVAQSVQAGDPAQVEAVRGVLLSSADGKEWKALAAGAVVPAGRELLALFDADLRSANGAVALHLRSDLGEVGPLPALEAVARIQDNPMVDVDVALECGVIVIRNMKKEGAAHVTLRLRGEELQLTLHEPGTKIGVETYARHAPGLTAKQDDQPTLFVFLLISEGTADISHGAESLTLKAPPGPAFLRWDSILKTSDIVFLKTLPDWGHRTPAERNAHERISAAMAAAVMTDAPADAAAKLAKSSDALLRKAGVVALGALDRVEDLSRILESAKEADVRNEAILVLRHLLGRKPGQIKKVEEALGHAGLSGNQAQTVAVLLLGFDDQARARPTTYSLLVGELDHPKLAIRTLAHWHLIRLVPTGATIPYDASAADRSSAVEAWRQLIPPGEMPGKR